MPDAVHAHAAEDPTAEQSKKPGYHVALVLDNLVKYASFSKNMAKETNPQVAKTVQKPRGSAPSFSPILPHVPFLHRFEEPSAVTKSEWAVSSQWQALETAELGQKLAEIIYELVRRASQEPTDALAPGCFLRELSNAVAVLDGMAHQHPALWKSLAHNSVHWPILVTLNPRITRSQRDFLQNSLELGREGFLSMGRNSRTSTDDPATRYAISILATLKANRARAGRMDPHAPLWARQTANLQTFNKESWRCWWLLGKKAFKEAVPQPEDIVELKKLAHTKERAAEKRALILERIARAIKSLAPESDASRKS